MSRSVMGVSELVMEECCTAMLYDHMTLATFMVYVESIQQSKLRWITTNLKRNGGSDQEKTRCKKRDQIQEEHKSGKVKLYKKGCSQKGKPTCANFCKEQYGEYLLGTMSYFGCFKCMKHT